MSTKLEPESHLGSTLAAWSEFFLKKVGDEASSKDAWSDYRNPPGKISNAILDSEILLCFLLPESKVRRYRFDNEPVKQSKVAEHSLYGRFVVSAGSAEIPAGSELNASIKSALKQYFIKNSDADGHPSFGSNGYIEEKTKSGAKRGIIETVDAYAFSLSVSILTFLMSQRLLRKRESMSEPEQKDWREISDMASARITASMESLIASFAVLTTTPSDMWSKQCGRRWPEEENLNDLNENRTCREELKRLREQLAAIGFRIPESNAFEIGWSWGPLAPEDRLGGVEFGRSKLKGQKFYAENAPYLYFTINAIDSILDLNSPELEAGGLLSAEQLALASKLRSLAGLAARYWRAIASADDSVGGPGEWELEAVPFRTGDGSGSPYWNLYLSRVLLASVDLRDSDIERLASLAERLGEAGRVTTPPYPTDTDPRVREIHHPGLAIDLDCSGEGGPEFQWVAYDFAPQLLKMAGQIARISHQADIKQSMAKLSQRIWQHLEKRTVENTPGICFDDFSRVYGNYKFFQPASGSSKSESEIESEKKAVGYQVKGTGVTSWYMTERVVEALVIQRDSEIQKSRSSDTLRQLAMSLFPEAQAKVLEANADEGDRDELDRCSKLARDQPGEAVARLLKLLEKGSGAK